jgi:diguanylate cyclase (GGDEF)-like protein
MARHHRIRLLALAAVLVIAGSVWIAGEKQRSAADASSREITRTQGLRTTVLSRAADLSAYASTGQKRLLRDAVTYGQELETTLVKTREDPPGGSRGLRLLGEQELTATRWSRLADAMSNDMVANGRRLIRPREGHRLEVALDSFEAANTDFLGELEHQREVKQASVGRMTVGLIVLLSAIFGGLAYVLFDRRARLDETRRERHAGFTDVMQLARTETEAYDIVKRHLQRIVPSGVATVLNRNNSANRLEAATPVEDPVLAEALEGAEPESCIALRSGRAHVRTEESDELLSCEICGGTPGSSTCMPSLVGGEVIGSVLVEHPRPLDVPDLRYLGTTIAEAAPIIANLRTLAVAELRAATDALTGLPNNRAVHETLRRMSAQSGRTAMPLAAILFDLDHFKLVNDVNGHAKGDEVLAAVGDAVASVVRASDFVGRYGGEEFLALLPDTGREGALHVAQKLRSAIAQIDVPGVSRKVTASFGVAVLPFDAVEPEQLLRVADRALYSAKGNGRDRVEVAVPREDGVDPAETALSSAEDG